MNSQCGDFSNEKTQFDQVQSVCWIHIITGTSPSPGPGPISGDNSVWEHKLLKDYFVSEATVVHILNEIFELQKFKLRHLQNHPR